MEKNKIPENIQTEITQEKPPEQVAKNYTEQEYNALKSQLDTTNDTIKSYEKIKARVENYKQK